VSNTLQTHISFSFFCWVILLYHPQVILEKQIKQEEKDAFNLLAVAVGVC
jgi:hypothetical protein